MKIQDLLDVYNISTEIVIEDKKEIVQYINQYCTDEEFYDLYRKLLVVEDSLLIVISSILAIKQSNNTDVLLEMALNYFKGGEKSTIPEDIPFNQKSIQILSKTMLSDIINRGVCYKFNTEVIIHDIFGFQKSGRHTATFRIDDMFRNIIDISPYETILNVINTKDKFVHFNPTYEYNNKHLSIKYNHINLLIITDDYKLIIDQNYNTKMVSSNQLDDEIVLIDNYCI